MPAAILPEQQTRNGGKKSAHEKALAAAASVRSVPKLAVTLVGFNADELDRCFNGINLIRSNYDNRWFDAFVCRPQDALGKALLNISGVMFVRLVEDIYSDEFTAACKIIELYRGKRNLLIIPVCAYGSHLPLFVRAFGSECPVYLSPKSGPREFALLIASVL